MSIIRYGEEKDIEELCRLDSHISKAELEQKISRREYLLMVEGDSIIGYLRYGLFWDEYPFMNLLYILDPFRGKGLGSDLVRYWEEEMLKKQYGLVVTSTQSDEDSQHFYRKLGYKDIGSFTFPGEWLELMLVKELK